MKKVRFSKNIKIVEISKLLYDNNLWWNNTDFLNANKSFNDDINRLFIIHPEISYSQIKYMLLQKNNICFDENNFV